MRFVSYIQANLRYYRKKLATQIDIARIRHLSRFAYRHMGVPSLAEGRIGAIRRPESIITGILQQNVLAVIDAERIVAGEFRIFSRTVAVVGLPDWHRDYFSGRGYEVHPYPSYTVPENSGADIIVPWELSRFLFVPTLISAFLETREDKYAAAFFSLLDDWQQRNPYLYGINWMCALDIAIRAYNIALGLIYFGESDEAAARRGWKTLWAHLVYLQERDIYEQRRTVNNHLLVAALLHHALLNLFQCEQASQWQAGVSQIIEAELAQQFRPDGGNYESALMYHQFVLEAMAVTLAVASDVGTVNNGDASLFPPRLPSALRAAFRFSANYTKLWKQVPQIGDSSDGRILMHRAYYTWHPSNPDYLADWSSALWREEDPFASPPVDIFPESGLALVASERYGAMLLAMPVARRAAGHHHFDKASILLQVDGIPVLVDAGTYTYTSDTAARKAHRCGRAHNVLLLDGLEQGAVSGPETFSVPEFINVGVEVALDGDGQRVFRAWHDGYLRHHDLGRIERQLVATEGGIELTDRATGNGRHRAELIFNVAPGLTILLDRHAARISRTGEVLCTIQFQEGWCLATESSVYSDSYGQTCNGVRVIASAEVVLPTAIQTTLLIRPLNLFQ